MFSRTGVFKNQPCFCSLCFPSRRPDHDDGMENPLRWLSIAPLAPKTPAHICVVISMHGHPSNPPEGSAVTSQAAQLQPRVMWRFRILIINGMFSSTHGDEFLFFWSIFVQSHVYVTAREQVMWELKDLWVFMCFMFHLSCPATWKQPWRWLNSCTLAYSRFTILANRKVKFS